MAIGDKFTLKDKYIFLDEECMNVYYYEQTAGSVGAEALAQQWVADILPLILEFQHANAVHSAIEVNNLLDDEDFHTEVLTTDNAGLLLGETLPRYNAWGFRKNRANSSYRNGSIRIAGIAEGSQDGGVAGSAALEDLGTFAAAIGGELTHSSGGKWLLRTPSGTFVGGSVPVPTPIASVQYVRMTTQNSRKR